MAKGVEIGGGQRAWWVNRLAWFHWCCGRSKDWLWASDSAEHRDGLDPELSR
jgi:hypothetical protein